MHNKNELMKFLGKCISSRISNETIGNLRWNFGHYTPVPNINDYDRLTINQYIIYYKIDRLAEFELIPAETRNELITLYDEYLRTNMEISEEVYKEMTIDGYKSDSLQELHSMNYVLRRKLMKYNLDDESFDLKEMIDNQIIAESENRVAYKVKNSLKRIKDKN